VTVSPASCGEPAQQTATATESIARQVAAIRSGGEEAITAIGPIGTGGRLVAGATVSWLW
jgi:hypothetical protein